MAWRKNAEDEDLIRALKDAIGTDNVLENEMMSAHTSFEVGGPAEIFAVPRSLADLGCAVRICTEAGVPLHILGKGTDLLVSDAGVRGVVVQIADNLSRIEREGGMLRVQAGASNRSVAEAALEAGLSGYEFASGIPGSVGGAAIMNAGAYDGEFKNVCTGLTCIDAKGNSVEATAWQACWGYRRSMMQDAGYVVAQVRIRLTPAGRSAIEARMQELQALRESKQPLELPSAGSTFKRPKGFYAGKLIQESGMQGACVGGAQVSTKHAGFVVNRGGATAADVLALIRQVQRRVYETSGVHLEPEVRLWGFDEDDGTETLRGAVG